jgi:hypothetical protein
VVGNGYWGGAERDSLWIKPGGHHESESRHVFDALWIHSHSRWLYQPLSGDRSGFRQDILHDKNRQFGQGGAVKIKDEKTGSMVTLQSSEVKEISEEEYEAGLKAQPPAPK